MAGNDSDDSSDNSGGYGQPPARKRFKKGESGNPRGRPKGSLNLSTLVRKELEKKIAVPIGGKMKRISQAEVAAKTWAVQLMKGNHKAREQILKLDERAAAAQAKHQGDEEIFVTMVLEEEQYCRSCGCIWYNDPSPS